MTSRKYKANLIGGPSTIFNHYQEKIKTKIKGNKYCDSKMGFDANALYLYAIGKNMCGEHRNVIPYDGIIEDILSKKFFG